MTFKLSLAVLVLAATPTFASATCYGDHAKEDIVMSCADGLIYDPATQTCVTDTTS